MIVRMRGIVMTLFLLVVLALAATFLVAAGASSQSRTKEPKQTLYYIPHTHWEGAVFFTREEYLDEGLSNILIAIHLMQKYPDYKFALDQVAYIKPLLERYPEEAAAWM
jgi:hypothetical protein